MPRYRITISSRSREAMLDLLRVREIRLSDHGEKRGHDGAFIVQAIATDEAIARLIAAGYAVEKHEDVDQAGQERQQAVGKGNRYEPGHSS